MKQNPSSTLLFYQGDKLTTVKQGTQSRTILRGADVPLAEQHTDGTPGTGLLATDDKGSVLKVSGDGDEESHIYSSYGHDPTLPSNRTVLGFNGERIEVSSESYLLGNGYRAYNPVLMRFHSPDSWSPFGDAGINAYCYCTNDPVNHSDPTGHIKFPRVFSYLDGGLRKPISLPSKSSETYYLVKGLTADRQMRHKTTLIKTKLSYEDPTEIYIPSELFKEFRKEQKQQRALVTYRKHDNPVDPKSFDKEIQRLEESIQGKIDLGSQVFEKFKPKPIPYPTDTVTEVRNVRASK